MKTLHTIDAVIDELGGPDAAAALVNAGPRTVRYWRKGLPPKTFRVITDELARRGCSAPISLWTFAQKRHEAAE